MYKLLLILKYLRRKLAPMFAASAVMLCTAMVIIVISVMGGFLKNLRESAHRLTGDVVINAGTMTGFPHYEKLITALEKLPQVDTATPVINTYGLITIMGRIKTVQVQGVRPYELDRVVPYRETLHWKTGDLLEYFDDSYGENLDEVLAAYRLRLAQRDLVEDGMTLDPSAQRKVQAGRDDLAGIVIGIEVSPKSHRDEKGKYDFAFSAINEDLVLTVVPISKAGVPIAMKPRPMAVLNEFKSGLLEVDANTVFVSFDVLQKMLMMDQAQEVDDKTGELTGKIIPGRTTEILVKAAGSAPDAADNARIAVQAVMAQFVADHQDMPLLQALTWEEQHQHMLGAVQNEKGLVTFLFVIISAVAIVMVATTFYMIVLEKTRDIGVLRALGASRLGIMNIYLGYGLAIGIVGSLLGLGLAVLVVTHLNEIQSFLADWFGWRMWDPRVYYFDRIPDSVDAVEALSIVVGAIISSVIGALIPALLAARLDPIEALRYE